MKSSQRTKILLKKFLIILILYFLILGLTFPVWAQSTVTVGSSCTTPDTYSNCGSECCGCSGTTMKWQVVSSSSCPPDLLKGTYPGAKSGSSKGIFNPAVNPSVGTGEGATILGNYIAQILAVAFIFAGIFLMAMILWAAYDWMLSGADEARLAAAKKRLTSALAGFIVLVALRALLAFLASALHIEWLGTLKITWPSLL